MEEIKCYKCGYIGNIESFVKHTISKKRQTGLCKKCDNKVSREWRKKNKEKVALYAKELWKKPERKRQNKIYVEKIRFGFNATESVKDKCCEKCGLTNNQHFEKYHERLHIHHIDNNGRHNTRNGLAPINQIQRMQILCRSCHVKEDAKNRNKYKKDQNKIVDNINIAGKSR